jgi:hypothetical protein
MASDRGTIPRGGVSDQQWAEPTAPGGRRMPSAPRERKPALAILAVLLVALGGTAAGYLVIDAGHKVAAIEIVQEVNQGQQIPASAMQEVEISGASSNLYIPWMFESQVAKVYASTTIPADTLLTPNMTERSPGQAQDGPQVGLSLKTGQDPANLAPGDTVQAIAVGTGTDCATTPDQTLGQATVVSVSNGVDGANASVTLALPTGSTDSPLIAGCANAGDVALVLMPSGGTG